MIPTLQLGQMGRAVFGSAEATLSGPHRYWRIDIVSVNSGTTFRIGEVEFLKHRYYQVATGTYTGTGTTVAEAYDNDRGSSTAGQYWEGLVSDGRYLYIDAGVGNDFELAAVALWKGGWIGTNQEVTEFYVSHSDDATSWTTLWTETAIPSTWPTVTPRVFENPHFAGVVTVALDTTPLHWLKLDDGVFSDAGITSAVNNDGIQQATNHGTDGTAFAQATAGARPVFKTGGINSKPYLQSTFADARHFEDVAWDQPSGLSAINPWCIAFVSDNVNATNLPAIIYGDGTRGGKGAFYMQTTASAQLYQTKTGLAQGTIANPQVYVGTVSTPSRVDFRQNETPGGVTQATNLITTACTTGGFLRAKTAANYWHGDLYEVLLYNGTTIADPTLFNYRISEYLRAKYGL